MTLYATYQSIFHICVCYIVDYFIQILQSRHLLLATIYFVRAVESSLTGRHISCSIRVNIPKPFTECFGTCYFASTAIALILCFGYEYFLNHFYAIFTMLLFLKCHSFLPGRNFPNKKIRCECAIVI